MLNDKPSILIADDEPNICRIAKLMISSDDFDVVTAENGLDAYEKAIKFQPSLVFADILMPKCDGFELCLKLKSNEQTKHIPFVFLTGLDEKQFKSRLAEVNADDYLTKPFSSHQMKEKINRWVKKPIVHSEDIVMPMELTAEKNNSQLFQFGAPDIDEQLNGSLYPQSFILLHGPIGRGKSDIARQFIMEGIKSEQLSMLISFESLKQNDPIHTLNDTQKRYFHLCDASRWTAIDSAPWRNIDYIFDYVSTECSKRSFQRIVFDSFSMGFAFWSLPEILKFIDLCRALPNAEKQCILWTINSHHEISTLDYHFQQMMDVSIKLNDTSHKNALIEFSKWQSVERLLPTERILT